MELVDESGFTGYVCTLDGAEAAIVRSHEPAGGIRRLSRGAWYPLAARIRPRLYGPPRDCKGV